MNAFGLASTVFRAQSLGARELNRVAAAGFTHLEVVSAPGHFDVTDSSHVAALQAAAGNEGISIAAVTAEPSAAQAAVETAVALSCPLVVVRTRGCATAKLAATPSGEMGLLKTTVDDLAPGLPAGVRLAIDFPAWPALRAEDLVDFLESADVTGLGVSLDAGHAALGGSAVDAAEFFSGFLAMARLHDNHGRDDQHRVPGAGAIDWPAVITSCWKTGFTGPWILGPISTSEADTDDVLRRTVGARTRLQAILEDLAQPFTFTE